MVFLRHCNNRIGTGWKLINDFLFPAWKSAAVRTEGYGCVGSFLYRIIENNLYGILFDIGNIFLPAIIVGQINCVIIIQCRITLNLVPVAGIIGFFPQNDKGHIRHFTGCIKRCFRTWIFVYDRFILNGTDAKTHLAGIIGTKRFIQGTVGSCRFFTPVGITAVADIHTG